MKINDIRNDLEPEVFLDDSRKTIWVSWKDSDSQLDTKDIYQWINRDIFLQWNVILKISQKNKSFTNRKKLYFDPVFKSKFKKNINLSNKRFFDKQYLKEKLIEYKSKYSQDKLQQGLKDFYKKIPLQKDTSQYSHNFVTKKIQYSTKKQDVVLNKKPSFIKKINFNITVNENIYKKLSNIFWSFNNVNVYKKLWVVFCALIVSLFWLKISIQDNVNNGYNKLIALKNWDLSWKTIEQNFDEIYNSFATADKLYRPISLIPNQTVDNGYHVIKWWKQIWYFWKYFLDFYENIKNTANNTGIENIYFSEFLKDNRQSFYNFEKSLSQSILHYNQVTSVGDTKLQKTFDDTIEKLKMWVWLLKTININFEDFLWLLWHYEQKDYLIVFQNNDEIRPTGWFMWSMWVISIYKWKVLNIKKSDVYAYEWDINKTYESIADKTLAPEGLHKITWTWWLRDSNYYPEVKRSSHEIKWFLDRIDENIDGIIYINKSTIEEILRVSWWIEFEAIWEKLTHENFSRVISTLVEAKVSKQWTLGTPKQVLFDFAEDFYQNMQENSDYIPYAKVIFNHILSRDIMMYSFNSSQNSLLWKLWINWEIPFHKTLDFTYPVYTSISWNKSDRYIQTEYEKNIFEFWECNYYTNFTITRKHTYNKQEEELVDELLHKFDIADKEYIKYIQWKWDNYQYMRVLLPKYAVVTPKDGMKLTIYDKYQVAEFYIKTRLYETTEYKLEYYINKQDCNWYSYKHYKQPWQTEYKMSLDYKGEKIFARDLKKDFFIKR